MIALLDGPVDNRVGYGMQVTAKDEMATVIAPVKDLEALAKKIDFAEVVFYDTENKVLILGPPGKVR